MNHTGNTKIDMAQTADKIYGSLALVKFKPLNIGNRLGDLAYFLLQKNKLPVMHLLLRP
jgi:hypothetical protein